VLNNPLKYIDPSGHKELELTDNDGSYIDQDGDEFINDVWYDNLVEAKNGWRMAEESKAKCKDKNCKNREEYWQKTFENRADEIRNNPCNYIIANGCIDGDASFIYENGKVTGVAVDIKIEEEKSGFFDWLFGKKAHADGLPDSTVGSNSYGQIVHYFHSGDHGPAHVHVIDNKGNDVRVGQNGKPLEGEPELNRVQQKLVNQFKPQIRISVGRIMRWYSGSRPPGYKERR
jgi:hypothetical protein